MNLRTTLGAGLSALALVLSMAGSAQAAQGNFTYKYVDGYGAERQVTLHDPHSGKCINLHCQRPCSSPQRRPVVVPTDGHWKFPGGGQISPR
ncbi:hypothetical protein ACFYN3_41010, partial [Streptomyces lavendulae]